MSNNLGESYSDLRPTISKNLLVVNSSNDQTIFLSISFSSWAKNLKWLL